MEQLTQKLHATQEELSRSRQHAHQGEQSIQGLQEQLVASQTKVSKEKWGSWPGSLPPGALPVFLGQPELPGAGPVCSAGMLSVL